AVFEHVEVECAHFHSAEIQNSLVDLVERKLAVPAKNVGGQGGGLAQHVLIQHFEFFEGQSIVRGIEVVQVAQTVLEQIVPDGAVVFRDALHQALGSNDVLAEVN